MKWALRGMTKFAHLLTLLKWFCFYISFREYPNCFLRLFKQIWTSPHGWLNVTCDCYKEDKTWSEEKTHRHSWRLINQYVDQVESVAKPLMKSKPKSESPAIKKEGGWEAQKENETCRQSCVAFVVRPLPSSSLEKLYESYQGEDKLILKLILVDNSI